MRLISIVDPHRCGCYNICREVEDELRELFSDRGAFVLVALAALVFLVVWVVASVNGALSDDAVEHIACGVVLPHTIAIVEPMLVLVVALSAWRRERFVIRDEITFVDAVRLVVAKSLVYSSVFMLNSIVLLSVCLVWYGTPCSPCVVVSVTMLLLYVVLVICVGFVVAYLLRGGRGMVAIVCGVLFVVLSPGGMVADTLGTMCATRGVCAEVVQDAVVVLSAVVVGIVAVASAYMRDVAN